MNSGKEPLISIVLVSWNGLKFLKGCFESIYSQGFKDFEVIFVDNGSTDSSVESVRENFPAVLIIENTENAGFARANNQGIKKATGKYTYDIGTSTHGAYDVTMTVRLWDGTVLDLQSKSYTLP